jgi:hypothetical protein
MLILVPEPILPPSKWLEEIAQKVQLGLLVWCIGYRYDIHHSRRWRW